VFDEGNCARRYWQLYFPAIGWSATAPLLLFSSEPYFASIAWATGEMAGWRSVLSYPRSVQ